MRQTIQDTKVICDVCNQEIGPIFGSGGQHLNTSATIEELDLCPNCSCKFVEYLYSSRKINKEVMLEAIEDIKSRTYMPPPGVILC